MIGRRRMPLVEGTVVAVDSGSRSVSASQAAEHVSRALPRGSRRAMSSTRPWTPHFAGNVSAELEASFKASGRKMLVFAPAFPAAGRTTVAAFSLWMACR